MSEVNIVQSKVEWVYVDQPVINGNTEMDPMIQKITTVNSMDSTLKIDQLLASDTVEVKYYHSENWHEPIDHWPSII